MSHLYKALCKLGPRLIDDSKRVRDHQDPDNSEPGLRSSVGASLGFDTVRQLVRYGTTTDDLWSENMEEAIKDGRNQGDPPRKVAYRAAEAWLEQVRSFVSNSGSCNWPSGWRLKKSDRAATKLLVEAVEKDLAKPEGS